MNWKVKAFLRSNNFSDEDISLYERFEEIDSICSSKVKNLPVGNTHVPPISNAPNLPIIREVVDNPYPQIRLSVVQELLYKIVSNWDVWLDGNEVKYLPKDKSSKVYYDRYKQLLIAIELGTE